MKTITISRKRGYYAAARALNLYVDGQKIGSIRQNETQTFEIPYEARKIVGKMDWARTEAFDLLTVPDGATLTVSSWMTSHFLRNIGILTMPMKFEFEA